MEWYTFMDAGASPFPSVAGDSGKVALDGRLQVLKGTCFFPEIREVGCSLRLLPGSALRFRLLFRVDAVRLRAATDREISTRRAQPW